MACFPGVRLGRLFVGDNVVHSLASDMSLAKYR
jgi:hypothetical protein